jgi:hypothetical protein
MVASACHTFSGCSTVELPDRLGCFVKEGIVIVVYDVWYGQQGRTYGRFVADGRIRSCL